MKGKQIFSQLEANEIIRLIHLKILASTEEQKKIRGQIRRKGFYASDFGLANGYTSDDFLKVVSINNTELSFIDITEQKTTIKNKSTFSKKKENDEEYVLDICDKILNLEGKRQHRFSFLIGDSGVKLPVDIYYDSLNLVVEYREIQHTEPDNLFDKRETVSGVTRGEQRKIYDQRRRDVLPRYGVNLIEISYSDFDFDSKKRIIRDINNDEKIVENFLKNIDISSSKLITTKQLSELTGLSSRKVNSWFTDNKLMYKKEEDWITTKKGKELGGVEKAGQYGKFIVWPEEIAQHITE